MKSAIIFIENYVAGGSDKVARLLIDHLPFEKVYLFVNKSNDTSVLLDDSLPKNVQLIWYKLFSVTDLNMMIDNNKNNLINYIILRFIHTLLKYPLILFSTLLFFIQFRKINADLFIANNGGYPGGEYCRSATIAASLIPKTRVFHIFHNMAYPPAFIFAPIEWVFDYLIDIKCQLIGVSQATVKRIKEKRNIKQDVKFIYNGLYNKERKQYYDTNFLKLLNVGYLGSIKNQEMILKALEIVINKGYKNIKIYFVGKEGEKNYLNKLKQLSTTLKLEDYVSFEGYKANLFEYYENCNIFVLSSLVESLPMVILEAMSVGMPVIATNVGGTDEQIQDGTNGFIIPADDINMMADKFIYFIENKSEIEVFGKKSYEIFNSKFTIDKMMSSYIKLLGLVK